MSLASLNPFTGSSQKVEPIEGAPVENKKIELNAQIEGAVEGAIEGAVEGAKAETQSKFEWNVERLFAHNENHSLFRTWFVRILSLVVGIPTLFLDLVRLGAFKLNLVDGKSFSLIDKASEGCQSLAAKVSAAYSYLTTPKELTLDEQNEISKQKMKDAAAKYVASYQDLNGGYFHSNNSFSTPHALKAEAGIRSAKRELISLANEFAIRNAGSTDGVSRVIGTAKELVRFAIDEAAQDNVYIENKVARLSPRLALRDVAFAEFEHAFEHPMNKSSLASKYVELASNSENFAADLRKGVESGILTEEQAKGAVGLQAEASYVNALKEGAQEAETAVTAVLNAGIKEGVVSRDEAVAINEKIQPPVEDLAQAAAKDIAKDDISEMQVKTKLIQTSKALQKAKRLKDKDVSAFLTSAEAALAKAKVEVEAERIRLEAETVRLEAERVALVQKTASQQSLFSQFDGMLELISKKQSELTSQFVSYDQMEIDRLEIAKQLEEIRDEKVTIRGSQVTILSAAGEYFDVLVKLSASSMTPIERKNQLDALEAQGFTAQTIAKIEQLKALEPRFRDLINRQAALAVDAEKNHDEVVRLKAVYRVFRKNNFKGLETANRKAVGAQEVVIERTQKTLNDRHLGLVGKSGIRARLTLDQPSSAVNVDPEANRSEVAALVENFRKPAIIVNTEVLIPNPSTLRWIYEGLATPFRWVAGIEA